MEEHPVAHTPMPSLGKAPDMPSFRISKPLSPPPYALKPNPRSPNLKPAHSNPQTLNPNPKPLHLNLQNLGPSVAPKPATVPFPTFPHQNPGILDPKNLYKIIPSAKTFIRLHITNCKKCNKATSLERTLTQTLDTVP